MEQSGFRPEQQQAYQGAKGGWQQFFAKLEQVVAKLVSQDIEKCSEEREERKDRR